MEPKVCQGAAPPAPRKLTRAALRAALRAAQDQQDQQDQQDHQGQQGNVVPVVGPKSPLTPRICYGAPKKPKRRTNTGVLNDLCGNLFP